MSEKDLGRALLDLDSRQLAGIADPREQTWKILERDRRRVWRWTALTIALWSAAILMVLLMLIGYGLVFPLQAKLAQEDLALQMVEEQASHMAEGHKHDLIDLRNLTPEQRKQAQFKAQIMFQMITVGVTASVGLTCLAILSSILLNRASRRATLRQINASLLEISQQLKELRATAGTPPKAQ
jgi:hypothetical protein